jgi:glycosyltransferase involved in cell wall biosynthesis
MTQFRFDHAPGARRTRATTASVVHVLWSMEIGGAERAVYQLVREQRRRGREADVIVASTAGLYGERARETGAYVYELRARSAFDLGSGASAADPLSRYDIVHFHCIEPALIRLAARMSGPRLFYTHRAGLFSYPLKRRVRYGLARRYLRHRFQDVSANTVQAARAASKLFGNPEANIPVIYNGLDFSLLAPQRSPDDVLAELGGSRDGAVRIGTTASLRDLKRIDRLLHAVAELSREPLECVIVGDGPERRALEQLSVSLGIDDRVAFIGEKGQIGDYLQVFDVFTLPSGPEESFGNSAVEAMGCGLPTVVFSDGGGLTEHITDGQTGFLARDQAEYVQRLKQLIESEETRRLVGDAGRLAVEGKYSPETMVDRFDELYEYSNHGSADSGRGAAQAR